MRAGTVRDKISSFSVHPTCKYLDGTVFEKTGKRYCPRCTAVLKEHEGEHCAWCVEDLNPYRNETD